MIVVFDTETVPFGVANMAPPLVVLSLGDSQGAALVHHTEAEPIAREMLGADVIVGHNVAYDMAVLCANFPALLAPVFCAYEELRVTDTGMRQRLLDLAAGSLGWAEIDGKNTRLRYSLAELAKRHFGVDVAKGEDTWRKRYGELRDIPCEQWPAEAREYAELDVTMCARICGRQGDFIVDERRQTRAAFWAELMSAWGITTSPDAVAEFERMARTNYERLAKALVEAGLKRPDRTNRKGEVVEGSRDTKAAMARLVAAYAKLGRPHPKTATGLPQLDDDACRKSGDPLLEAYADFGSASKVLSSDVKMLHKHSPLVHANFNVLLETGDIGCSNPNLVNLPTQGGLRECFAPRPGFVYLACDYAAIQLRTWAQCCINMLGYSDMAEVLNRGDCPHSMVAADIRGERYEDMIRLPKKTYYFERQCGKVVNFGRPGGMGAARLVHAAANQYHVEITEQQAKGLCRTWERRWREARPYLDRISVMTANGRIAIEQYYSRRKRGGLEYCDAANGIFSALSYDAMKEAAWLVCKACYEYVPSVLNGSRIVNVIHDELLLEVPEDIATECAEEVERLMIEAARPWIPDVPAKVESTLMRRWSKGAASERLPDGRLSIWQ